MNHGGGGALKPAACAEDRGANEAARRAGEAESRTSGPKPGEGWGAEHAETTNAGEDDEASKG